MEDSGSFHNLSYKLFLFMLDKTVSATKVRLQLLSMTAAPHGRLLSSKALNVTCVKGNLKKLFFSFLNLELNGFVILSSEVQHVVYSFQLCDTFLPRVGIRNQKFQHSLLKAHTEQHVIFHLQNTAKKVENNREKQHNLCYCRSLNHSWNENLLNHICTLNTVF